MSEGGGDPGGGKGSGGGGDTGSKGASGGDTGGKGGGNDPGIGGEAGAGPNTSPVAGGGYTPLESGGGAGESPLPYAPSEPLGGSGGLPPEIFPGPTAGPAGADPLGGPGPVGGGSGLPGAGGGENTPWAGIPGLEGNEFSYIPGESAPIAGGGVSAVGGESGASNPNTFTGPTLDDLVGTSSNTGLSGAAASPGTSAGATAAPAGVESVVDLGQTPSTRERVQGGGTSSAAAARAPGLLESLGLTSSNMQGLGIATAGAGLLNNLINGRGDTESAQALRQLAQQAQQRQGELTAQSGPQRETGARVSAAGERQIAQGEGITQQGRDIISSGQGQLPGGQALQQWIQTGTLPAAYESQVMEGINAARTRAISNAAAAGQPTDPARNSTLAENIRQIEARAPEMRMALAQTLANTGTGIIGSANSTIGAGSGVVGQGNATVNTGGGAVTTGTNTANSLINAGIQNAGLSSNIYQALLTNENAQNQRRGQAIGNFAAALNSGQRRAA